ncbi:MAG: winged helix-turn-helix transcriptional regulator [Planctomycetota bacterium]
MTPAATTNPERLIDLFHRRWNVPVLAELHRGSGAKLATLVHRLGQRASVRAAIDFLIAHGLARRNPGYGHPLRPEFVLTPAGDRIGPAVVALVDEIDRIDAGEVAYRKWSMPTLAAIAGGAERFGEIRHALPGVTDRALSLALKDLSEAGLTRRVVDEGQPVVVSYELTNRGKRLGELL